MNAVNAFQLVGKVAIVTGSASGIGESIARTLASVGARIVVADLDGDGAERTASAINAEGGEAIPFRVDVTDPSSVDDLVAATIKKFGRLDTMVNNAGIMIRTPLIDISAEEFEKVLSVNLKSVLYGSQAAARVMEPGSSIINTLSAIIDRSTVGTGAYAASKKGVEALTRTFAIELGPRNIRVNGIAPGWAVTGITRSRVTDEDGNLDQSALDTTAEKMAATSPLNAVMDTVDAAYAVQYLASEAARFMTGQVLRVNGGMSMV